MRVKAVEALHADHAAATSKPTAFSAASAVIAMVASMPMREARTLESQPLLDKPARKVSISNES